MNWEMVGAVFAMLTFFTVLIGGGVMWGSITEKVSGLVKRADSANTKIAVLDDRVNAHQVEIAELKAWNRGYDAAASARRQGSET